MIFKNINNLHTPSERALFRELVLVYSKIVQEMCARGGKIFQVETFKTIDSMELLKIEHEDFTLSIECTKYSDVWAKAKQYVGEHLKKIAEFYQVDCDELHALWVADKLSEFAQGLPQEVFEQAISILNRERDKDNGEGQ